MGLAADIGLRGVMLSIQRVEVLLKPWSVDTLDPLPGDFLRAQIKSELFAHHCSEEAADRVLLPMGRPHDGRNRRSLRPVQHGQHASLFRARPAVVQ